MSTDFRLDILTPVGIKQAEVTDFLELAYTRRVNAAGLLTFVLDGQHSALSYLEDKAQVIVYRRNTAMGLTAWTADFWGLYRDEDRDYTDQERFTARCNGIVSMLGWRPIAYKAGTNNRSRFAAVAAETIMKTLVSYNAGAQATTANSRELAGAITGLTVQADGGGGNILSLSCAWRNLLTVLQEIALVGGGDFDLIRTGAQAWDFRWYTGQQGTDRTATVIFALARGNMANPRYRHTRSEERTVAIVGGPGEGEARRVVVRYGINYSAANHTEMFVDGHTNPSISDVALNAAGDAALDRVQAREEFSFKILQTPASFYGVHYDLGDLVTARYRSYTSSQKIVAVSVSADNRRGEVIDVETETV